MREPLLATPITEAKIVMLDHPSCCTAIQIKQWTYRQITNPSTHTIKREEPKVAKLSLDYHGKVLEFYRKGGKPTIQKDVVVICLKIFTLLPDGSSRLRDHDIHRFKCPTRGWN